MIFRLFTLRADYTANFGGYQTLPLLAHRFLVNDDGFSDGLNNPLLPLSLNHYNIQGRLKTKAKRRQTKTAPETYGAAVFTAGNLIFSWHRSRL
ncbi:hypothetical protein L4G92_06110 [Neisseria sp. ZJ106]|uniref:Uncharacterized protein n=1 Tax=Neisseria lisongii TaxID=2912188 RepID=A0ABY7RIJ3_9NEIS|nr:hypothetical protein [Neisseria lisongii]MCF7521620.1 hypothetical protein [Neisseria lisongii]WCL70855.1 hypothetical protein PJU73_05640 [Neisseria lisongii]